MKEPYKLWTRQEIVGTLGDLMINNPLAPISESDIPPRFHYIRHYAEIWGIPDESDRMQMVENTPDSILDDLCLLMRSLDDDLEEWLCGDEADSQEPTMAYVCYAALVMAFDDAWSSRSARLRSSEE